MRQPDSLTRSFRALTLRAALLGLAVLSALTVLPTPAEAYNGEVRALRVEVEDASTGRRVYALSPCEGIELLNGDRVRVRLVAVDNAGQVGTWAEGAHIPVRFFPIDRGNVIELTKADVANGDVRIYAQTSSRSAAGETTLLGYEIDDSVALGEGIHRRGAISVNVAPTGGAAASSSSTTRTPGAVLQAMPSRNTAEKMVDNLYRGILMRAPDAGGAQPRIEDLRTGGYDALRKNAMEIAGSEESRGLSSRVSREERLAALYQYLLGVDMNQVSAEVRGRHYSYLVEGNISAVVDDIVSSTEFRQRQGLSVVRR